MNYILKTYLLTLALTTATLPICSADVIDPKILAESKRLAEEQETKHRIYELSEYEAAVQASLRSAKPKTRAQLEQEEIDLALALSASLEREHKATSNASEELARRLQQEENKKRKQALDDRKAAQRIQEQDDREYAQQQQRAQVEHKKKTDEEAERKRKAEYPIKDFVTVFHAVHPQEGTSCGLHAIDNGNKCYIALEARIAADEINKLLMTGLSSAAQTIPAGERNNLDTEKIPKIGRDTLKMNPYNFTLLENIVQSKDEFLRPLPRQKEGAEGALYIPETLGSAIQALRTEEHALHIFILANTTIEADAKELQGFKGKDDHWISIVADKKDGIVTFHYLDTGGGKDEAMINALRETIERGNYYGIQLAIQLAYVSPANIQALYIDNRKYAQAFDLIKERVDLAHKAGVINDPRFPKQEFKNLIKQIELLAPHEYRKRAAELLRELR